MSEPRRWLSDEQCPACERGHHTLCDPLGFFCTCSSPICLPPTDEEDE